MTTAATNNGTTPDARQAPWREPWPPQDLETVHCCPVCGGGCHAPMYAELIDNTFCVAEGTWTLRRCGPCRSAFLSPRPTQASIGRAYRHYYTHQSLPIRVPYHQLPPLHKLRRRLVNGYCRHRYLCRDEPWCRLGLVAGLLAPSHRQRLDRKFRNLPKRPSGRLLDVGCGNGEFLLTAASCGWQGLGLELDQAALDIATAAGADVLRADISALGQLNDHFDYITLSHIIEHLHDPVALLRSCYRLLRKDGSIWLETPNIDSCGHQRFGPCWRGIEAPRHLVLFNLHSLRRLLREIGFEQIRLYNNIDALPSMTAKSSALKSLYPPTQERGSATGSRRGARCLLGRLLSDRSQQEFITLTAQK